jgi:putative PEP-CTERM system integral membrane protein
MDSEFATLNDLALSQGIKHSQLIEEIHDAILLQFVKKYPDQTKDVSIVVDEKTGQVKILSDKSDITPPEFAIQASSIARQVILNKLKGAKSVSQPPSQVAEKIPDTKPRKSYFSWVAPLLFWGYNLFYLFLLIIFLLGLFTQDFRSDLFNNLKKVGTYRLTLFFILVATPPASIIYSIRAKIKKTPIHLGKLFFLLEIPIIVLSFTFLSINNPIPPVWFFSLLVLLAPLVLYTRFSKTQSSSLLPNYLSVTLTQLILISLVYLVLLYSFFSPLIVGALAHWAFDDIILDLVRQGSSGLPGISSAWGILYLLIVITLRVLGLLLAAFFILLPYGVTYLFSRLLFQAKNRLAELIPEQRTHTFMAGLAILTVVSIVGLSYQPNIRPYLDTIENLDSLETFEERDQVAQELSPHQERIHQAITDMRYARRRYLFLKDDNFLEDSYHEVFDLNPTSAKIVQSLFTNLAYPFVYRGPIDSSGLISKNFIYLFGDPQAKPSPTPAANQPVKLLSRKITTSSDYQDLLATISIEEEYTNTTYNQREVVYEFSLPADAVITDLKLGPQLEHPGIIAPKGAARTVYERELNRRRDPALLEQTGPRQYRLRVFPIPAKNDKTTLGGKNQRVLYTYMVGLTPDGYPLPNYFQTQNLQINSSTKFSASLNNQTVSLDQSSSFITDPKNSLKDPCQVTDPLSPRTTYNNLSPQLIPHLAQDSIKSSFDCQSPDQLQLPSKLINQRIAILYDVSIDNQDDDSLDQLEQLLSSQPELLSRNQIDLYLFNDRLSQPRLLSSTNFQINLDITYFGPSQLLQALSEFTGYYDLLIVASSQEQIPSSLTSTLPQINSPIYLIHTSKTPPYPNALTYLVLQTGGQVTDSFAQSLNLFTLSSNLQPTQDDLHLLSINPYWSLVIQADQLPSINDYPVPTAKPSPVITRQPVCASYFKESGSSRSVQGTFTTDSTATSSKDNCLAYMRRTILSQSNCGRQGGQFVNIALIDKSRHTFDMPTLTSDELIHSQFCPPPSPSPTITLSPTPSPTPVPPPPSSNYPISQKDDPLSFLISRAYLSHQISQYQGDDIANDLDFLDATQNYAKKTNIVTPFSSLIALVNQQQLKQLEKESVSLDRYKSAQESASFDFPVDAVSEFNLRSFGGSSLFGGLGTSQAMPMPYGGGGGGGGPDLGIAATNGGGSGYLLGNSLIWLFIMANGLIIGGGFALYAIRSFRKHLARKKQK